MPRFNRQATYFRQINRQYQNVARIIQALIASHVDPNGGIRDYHQLEVQLARYGQSLGDWAMDLWQGMLQKYSQTLRRDWAHSGIKISVTADEMATLNLLAAANVTMIKTLPENAAKQAVKIARQAAMETGDRAEYLVEQLRGLRPGYPQYAAKRLARTEVSKAQMEIVQVQAASAGCTHYIWRCVGDPATRESHLALEGQVFEFNHPPYIEGEGYHGPGEIWNCFTGDTLAGADCDIKTALRAPYSGEIINLQANGHFISVTPNHPMLTPKGWAPAGELKPGSKLLALPFENTPPRLERLHDLFAAGRQELAPDCDFYGDTPCGPTYCARFNARPYGKAINGARELEVEDITVGRFSGFVYTLETGRGWYSVGHDLLIVKNCRCHAEPIISKNFTNLNEGAADPQLLSPDLGWSD